MGGLTGLRKAIAEDFEKRHPQYHKTRGEGLVLLASLMLETRTPNLNELAEALPREIGTPCSKRPDRYFADGPKPYNDTNEVLMLAVRLRKRALPVAWRVRSTQGNIGFPVQKELLNSMLAWLPDDVKIMLAADRFYGTAQLIEWCRNARWSYRIRLKGNLTLIHEGGEITTGAVAVRIPQGVKDAELYRSGVKTHIGVLHEKGQKQPWIIAMDAAPSTYTVLDYGMRWGIENMFSDFKSRGFGLMQSQIQKPDRMERLILVMSLALYWATSCGMFAEHQVASGGQKRCL